MNTYGIPSPDPLKGLEARLEALEESGLGVGKKMRFGSATAVWPIKGFESSTILVRSGFSKTVNAAYGIPINFASYTLTVAKFEPPNIIFLMRNVNFEQAAGTEIDFFWLAIGE